MLSTLLQKPINFIFSKLFLVIGFNITSSSFRYCTIKFAGIFKNVEGDSVAQSKIIKYYLIMALINK